jgi:hypothetical protein
VTAVPDLSRSYFPTMDPDAPLALIDAHLLAHLLVRRPATDAPTMRDVVAEHALKEDE